MYGENNDYVGLTVAQGENINFSQEGNISRLKFVCLTHRANERSQTFLENIVENDKLTLVLLK